MTKDVIHTGIQHITSVSTITVIRFSILRFSVDLDPTTVFS